MEWGKVSRLVVTDARTGEVVREVTPIGLRLHLSSQAAADALRALAG